MAALSCGQHGIRRCAAGRRRARRFQPRTVPPGGSIPADERDDWEGERDDRRAQGGIEKTLTSVDTRWTSANALLDDVGDDVKAMASAGARISGTPRHCRRHPQGRRHRRKADERRRAVQRVATRSSKTAEKIAANTKEAVQQARQALEKLQSTDGQVTGVTASLKETIESTRTAMAGLSANMDALKRNFLCARILQSPRVFQSCGISPEEYRKGALTEDGDDGRVRVWLRDDVLFGTCAWQPRRATHG